MRIHDDMKEENESDAVDDVDARRKRREKDNILKDVFDEIASFIATSEKAVFFLSFCAPGLIFLQLTECTDWLAVSSPLTPANQWPSVKLLARQFHQ